MCNPVVGNSQLRRKCFAFTSVRSEPILLTTGHAAVMQSVIGSLCVHVAGFHTFWGLQVAMQNRYPIL